MPQIQFIVRVLVTSVLPQRQVRTVPNCAGDRAAFTFAVLGALVAPVVVQRQVLGRGLLKTVEVPQLRFAVLVVDFPGVAQRQPSVSLFIAVNMQRQVPAVWVSTLYQKTEDFPQVQFLVDVR